LIGGVREGWRTRQGSNLQSVGPEVEMRATDHVDWIDHWPYKLQACDRARLRVTAAERQG